MGRLDLLAMLSLSFPLLTETEESNLGNGGCMLFDEGGSGCILFDGEGDGSMLFGGWGMLLEFREIVELFLGGGGGSMFFKEGGGIVVSFFFFSIHGSRRSDSCKKLKNTTNIFAYENTTTEIQ